MDETILYMIKIDSEILAEGLAGAILNNIIAKRK